MQLFNLILKLFRIEKYYSLTSEYIAVYDKKTTDFRQIIHPKQKNFNGIFPVYRQVFSDKLGFIPNMSCIDLLFNEGNFANLILQI
jgi:hypothetical protein